MTTDLNTLLTGLYVKIDDHLGRHNRPGRLPRLSDAELLTLAVAQVLLGVLQKPAGCASSCEPCPEHSPTYPASPATTSACARRCR